MNARKMWNASKVALLPMLLCVPLLACATDPKGAENVKVEPVLPPPALLVLDEDPAKPTADELRGPNGQTAAGNYIVRLELSNATRGQTIRCLQAWREAQLQLYTGAEPTALPNYCKFN